MRRILAVATLLSVIAITLRASSPPSAELDALLRTAVEKKRVPMLVAMVADGRGVIYEHAAGSRKDAIFAIASMTKPVTSVAVMQLVEAGRVKLDDPASTYLPELGDVRVLDGGTMRPPKSRMTVRHLLTHTSGFGYEFMHRGLFDLVSKKAVASVMAGGDGFLRAPLVADPGAEWEYGIGTDWLGKLVERVSGQSLEIYFRDRIFRPLGMADSFFVVPADKQSRVVAHFQRTGDGQLAELPRQPQKHDGFFSGGGGLFSTAPDYMNFVRALLAGGELGGQRILSADSVALMSRNHIGDLSVRAMPSLLPHFAADRATLPGALDKFGLGFAINSGTAGTARGRNTMAWAGAFNTYFWIDREKQVGAVLFSQLLPFLDPEMKDVLDAFDRAVYTGRGGS